MRLNPDRECIDCWRFEALSDRAQVCEGDEQRRAFRAALGLYQPDESLANVGRAHLHDVAAELVGHAFNPA